MTTIVWITGRAATGKSTLITELAARLRAEGTSVHRLSDEDLLFQDKAADLTHEHHWHPDGDSARFVVRSSHLFDQGLRTISTRLTALVDAHDRVVTLVELARGRAAPVDVSYRRALTLIDPRLWAHSIVFRLDLPFASQLSRNQQRADHLGRATPEQAMLDLYDGDDPEAFVDAGIPVHPVRGEAHPQVNAAIVLTRLHQVRHNMS